jgi:beta-galactosidase
VPGLYLADDAFAAALRSYVEGGGHALVTYGSGIVDADNHVRLGGYPGAFADLLGIRTEEFYPLALGASVRVEVSQVLGGTDHPDWTGTIWSEDTVLRGATTVARYADGPLAGRPVITRHEVGRGAAWYVGTLLDPGAMHWLFGRVCSDAGTAPVVDLGAGSAVEAVRRRGEKGTFLFVINHGDDPVRVPTSGEDLVTGNRVEWHFLLSAGACAIIHEDEGHDA